jgi:cytochrome c-type biogenesis protein CcsB
MLIVNLENTLINLNFIILFIAMILYWLKSSFFFKNIINLPDKFIILSNILQFIFLLIRWLYSNHFPLSNLYESLLFLSYSLTSILLILNLYLFNFSNLFGKQIKRFPNLNFIFGSVLTPLILLINTFANFSLPTELKTITALVPALKSNWLLMHVTVMMLSYAALLCGCLFSLAYLILTVVIKKNNLAFAQLNLIKNKEENKNLKKNNLLLENLSSLMLTLDNLSYRILGLGFPLLTMGLLSGAVWANQTWGSYWSWDPKETWALITWFIFAIYFHTRLSKSWTGFKSALLASFGFIIIWVCYLGVNLMGKGLHSYGFLSN